MKAFVTGGTGFLGSAVVRQLLREGHQVRALVRASSDRRNLDGLRLEPWQGDLTDPESLHGALDGCEALFHLAADYRLWVPDPRAMYRVNVEGTENLMTAALREGVHGIVHTSSVATLGIPGDGTPGDEDTPVTLDDMVGHYKRSKFLSEELVKEMVADRGLPAVIVNPSTPVGPRDVKPTPTGRMIRDAALGRLPAYVDTGLNIVHVDDAARGHVLAFERGEPGERYVLGGEDMTLREILTVIAGLAGRSPPRLKLPTGAVLPVAYAAEAWARLTGGGDPLVTVDGVRLARKRMFFSSEKARKTLGYSPRPALEALEAAVAWFRREHT